MNSGEELELSWRSFPLEQVNSREDGWLLWEQPIDESRSLRAFLTSELVKRDYPDKHHAFVNQLLTDVHAGKMPIQDAQTLAHALNEVGLPTHDVLTQVDKSQLRQVVAADYKEGVEKYGAFGTPTLRINQGDASFVKLETPPAGSEALDLYRLVRDMAERRPYLREIKKPRPAER